MKKVATKKNYICSDGELVSQGQINSRLRQMKEEFAEKSRYGGAYGQPKCQGCGVNKANDFDHTISQKRCKELGKTELIWDMNNISLSCRTCHNEWESYKSGIFEEHNNVTTRLLFVKQHDQEGFQKRCGNLSNFKIMKSVGYE